jgi:CheY-like chemotaxis protein
MLGLFFLLLSTIPRCTCFGFFGEGQKAKIIMFSTMLVEDNGNFRQALKLALQEQFPSMNMIEARSGEEAIERVHSQSVDFIFMDINLPGQNGLKTTQKIRADYQDIPIAILTGHDLLEYRYAAIEAGANCFVNKNDFNLGNFFTVINCFQYAKQNGRKPICVRGLSGFDWKNEFSSLRLPKPDLR